MRTDWSRAEIAHLFDLSLSDLVFRARDVLAQVRRKTGLEQSTLSSMYTGGDGEDCGYSCLSTHHAIGLNIPNLDDADAVIEAAMQAKAVGSGRFCIGAAWRRLKKPADMLVLLNMVTRFKALGLEPCMTFGGAERDQVPLLASASLERYRAAISTRTFQDRLVNLVEVRATGMGICCGGAMGLGETRADRVDFLHILATLPEHPGFMPISTLMPIAATRLEELSRDIPSERDNDDEFTRAIAVTRIVMPACVIRLTAGREHISDATQLLCFMAGANSIVTGDRCLTRW